MAITFSIDNDRVAANIQDVTLDQSSQAQTQGTTDKGNDVDLSLTGGNIDGFGPNPGLDAGFETYLSTLSLTTAQLNFAAGNAATGSADAEGAQSSSNFIQVSASNGETISDLFFKILDDPVTHNQVVGMQTLAGENVYLHVEANGNFATLTTASGAGGRVVAAFGLYGETIAADQHSATAGVQMVTFEAIKHPLNPNPDDNLSITDVLQIGASASISFTFDTLPSGSFLYAAIGSAAAGLLVTGQDLNVNDTNKLGDVDTGGKDGDPSDTVNTSQGGIGATIGINSQHFADTSIPGGKADGPVGVFTLVKGFQSFDSTVNGTSQGTGINVNEINYDDYVNAPSAKIFVSQSTGGAALGGGLRISLWEAGGGDGGTADHATNALKPEELYADVAGTSQSYIGDQATDSHLKDDWAVVAGTVTVKRGATTYSWTLANSGTTQSGIKVTFDPTHTNTFTVTGLTTSDTIGFSAKDDPANPLDGTFNRFDVQSLANTNPVDIGRIDLDQGVQIQTGLGSHLFVDDDGPTISAVPNATTVSHDETPGVQANTDVDGTAFITGSSGPNVASLFANVPSPGDDLDVTGSGPIGYGRSGSALITVSGSAGTDGPASQELTYGLHVSDGTFSGASTTEGTQIFLYNGTGTAAGLVLGRVGTEAGATDTANSGGTVAFALAVNPLNGEVFLAQYLSLNHPTGGTSYDEAIQLITNSVQETVTRTDGDGDSVSDVNNDIGNLINFEDDGPNIAATASAATVTHDETPGVQADTDVPGSDLVVAGGATIASLFTNVPNQGDDGDVAGSGPIGFARSTSSMLTLSTNNAGADGPAAQPLNYAISVSDGTPSGVSTTEGTQIFMYNGTGAAAGLVLGRVGTEAGAVDNPNSSGTVAFALAVNPTTGELFTAQYLSLNHPTPGSGGASYDESIHLDSGALQMSVTLTDKDSDTITDSGNDIGDHVNFQDDGPNIVAAASATTVTHDETPGVQADTDVAGSALIVAGGATIASLFSGITGGDDLDVTDNPIGYARSGASMLTISTNNPGADGPAATPLNYALSTTDRTASGVSTTEGTQIFMYNGPNGTLIGRVGNEGGAGADTANDSGAIAFALAVNPLNGEVFVSQYLSLNHPTAGSDAASYDESIHLDAGAVQMSVTLTDKDGDTSTDSGNSIGDHVFFQDDGPSISLSAVTAPSITDDESDFTTNNSASYAANFTPVYGADGPAATGVTYGISATANADSGLIESGSGNHVFLFNESGVVVGRAGTSAAAAAGVGNIVFTATIDSTGKVTLDQQRAVVHTPNVNANDITTLGSAGLVQVTATVHDGDADTASTPLDIGTLLKFQDDAPTITAQILGGTVDFKVDPVAGVVSHSLNGAVGADIDSATQTSLTGVKQYTITGFTDVGNAVFPNLDGVLSDGGTVVTYYSTNDPLHQDSTTAVYRLTLDQTNGGAGSYKFEVLQPPPVVNNNFTFTDLPSGQNLFGIIAQNKANIDTHGTQGTGDDTLPDGGLLVFPSNPALDPASHQFTNASGTINTSKGGGPVTIGNGNQAFDNTSEGAYFMYVDNPNIAGVGGLGLTATNADDADTIRFDGTNEASRATVTIVQASGSQSARKPGPAMEIHAYQANPGAVDSDTKAFNLVNNPTVALSNQGTAAAQVNIIGIKIHTGGSNGPVIEYAKLDQATGQAILQDINGDNVVNALDDSAAVITFTKGVDNAGTDNDIYFATAANLAAGYTIEFITATDHNLALIQNAGGSYDIGGFNVIKQSNVPAQDFHFNVQINDYDNDVYGGAGIAFANFDVHVNGVIFS